MAKKVKSKTSVSGTTRGKNKMPAKKPNQTASRKNSTPKKTLATRQTKILATKNSKTNVKKTPSVAKGKKSASAPDSKKTSVLKKKTASSKAPIQKPVSRTSSVIKNKTELSNNKNANLKSRTASSVKKGMPLSSRSAVKSVETKQNAAVTTEKQTKPTSTPRVRMAIGVKSETGNGSYISKPSNDIPEQDYMNDINKAYFRKILIEWKKQLLHEMERTVHHMQDDVATFADPNDRATQETEFSLELRTRDRELKLIKKIEEALQRIDNNEYGYCEACGVQIGLKRLEARPTATLCIDCKTVDEIREKHFS